MKGPTANLRNLVTLSEQNINQALYFSKIIFF